MCTYCFRFCVIVYFLLNNSIARSRNVRVNNNNAILDPTSINRNDYAQRNGNFYRRIVLRTRRNRFQPKQISATTTRRNLNGYKPNGKVRLHVMCARERFRRGRIAFVGRDNRSAGNNAKRFGSNAKTIRVMLTCGARDVETARGRGEKKNQNKTNRKSERRQ